MFLIFTSCNEVKGNLYSLFYFHDSQLSETSNSTISDYSNLIKIKNESELFFKKQKVIDFNILDKNNSYLIDIFIHEKKQYLIISTTNSDELQSSSSMELLNRKSVLIIDLERNEKYTFKPSSGLIMTSKTFEGLGYGNTIKSIDTKNKNIIIKKNDKKSDDIKIPLSVLKK